MKVAPPDRAFTPLPELLRRAVSDSALQEFLFSDPDQAAIKFGLSEGDKRKLQSITRVEFEGALGRFMTYKLLPTPVGERILVTPDGGNGSIPQGKLQIVLDQSATGANIGEGGTSKNAGRVFGSGTHPTTRLCVHMLERYLKPGMRVLDLGTGSGILALAAARLGATEVVGLDVDPQTIPVAERNAERNQLEHRVRFSVGDAGEPLLRKLNPVDLVVSNILVEVHLHSLEQGLIEALRPGGRLILSGMHGAGAEMLAGKLAAYGCDLIDLARMGRWWVLVAEKAGE